MDEWGFTITTAKGRILYQDFGYETEEDAIKFGKLKCKKYQTQKRKIKLVTSQHWRELDY